MMAHRYQQQQQQHHHQQQQQANSSLAAQQHEIYQQYRNYQHLQAQQLQHQPNAFPNPYRPAMYNGQQQQILHQLQLHNMDRHNQLRYIQRQQQLQQQEAKKGFMIPSLINVEPNVFTQSPQVPLIIRVKWTAPIKYIDTIPTGTLRKKKYKNVEDRTLLLCFLIVV